MFAAAAGLFCLALSAQVIAQGKPDTKALGVERIEVSARAFTSFDKISVGRTKFGELEWVGGLQLTSASKQFGGWSGLALDDDGRGFIAVSDSGAWMRGAIDYDKGGRPKALKSVDIGPLKALNNQTLRRNRDRDAEAVVLVSGTTRRGKLLIAFEQNHRIGRFEVGPAGVSAPSSYVRPDKADGRMSALKGFEAMTVLKAGPYRGSILAIAERKHDAANNHTGWVWVKGKARRFNLTDIGGYDITDAAALDDGGLLVLERRFRWFEGVKMRLRHVPAGDIKPGAVIAGRVLMEANMGQEIDNMEGLAVHSDPGDKSGALIVTVISDDNFNTLLQRSLLLQFRWRPNEVRGANAG